MTYLHIAVLLSVTACMPVAENATSSLPREPDTCGLASFSHLKGRTLRELKQNPIPEYSRILLPDTMMTKDFREERINFIVDENNIITHVICG